MPNSNLRELSSCLKDHGQMHRKTISSLASKKWGCLKMHCGNGWLWTFAVGGPWPISGPWILELSLPLSCIFSFGKRCFPSQKFLTRGFLFVPGCFRAPQTCPETWCWLQDLVEAHTYTVQSLVSTSLSSYCPLQVSDLSIGESEARSRGMSRDTCIDALER